MLLIDRYWRRSEFVCDALQVFENCEIFNEDDSPVGQAGHVMKEFFYSRYRELVDPHLDVDACKATQAQSASDEQS